MAKGRVTFLTARGRSGAGKRTNTELDVLRLLYAVQVSRVRGERTFAYFCTLRAPDGTSLLPLIEAWLAKYDGRGLVTLLERLLSQDEYDLLQLEKADNARAQAREGGSALAHLAKQFAETHLAQEVARLHPTAVPVSAPPPLGIDWDVCLVEP